MTREVSGGLESLKLTNDELGRLKKAFGDPEFRRLFKEYADEITDPENRKRYEEEIRTMEREQGMEVEFINPTPGHCLKTRHWPSLLGADSSETGNASKNESPAESLKVFINVCKSDKVGCPVMKPIKNSSGKTVPNGMYWSLPHCFTPPREDLDKNKQKAMVYDVAFHPKAFELANTSAAMRRLLNVTAVEGVQRQFNLCLGKTAQQALHLTQLIKSASEPFSRPVDPNSTEEPMPSANSSRNRTESVAREEAILRTVHTLKGTAYKGMARPAVIRRRRTDYEKCQAELKQKTERDLQACTDPIQRETLTKISQFTQPHAAKTGPITPTYTITYSSDFDLINCRDAPDVNPVRPPDRLRVSIKLPGLVSSTAVDLELTSTNLSLTSEKPVAYQLDLKLPYEVDDSKGDAKFDKSTSTLVVTAPLKSKPNLASIGTSGSSAKPLITPVLVEQPSTCDESQTSPKESSTSGGVQSKKKRRKRNRRRNSSVSEVATVDGVIPLDDAGQSPEQVSEQPPEKVSEQTPDQMSEQPPDRVSEQTPDQMSEQPPDHVSKQESSPPDQPPIPEQSELSCSNEPFDCGLILEPSNHSSELGISVTPVTERSCIPISHVGLQQLIVNKDRRLAPVRFRQDPSSVSILFSVRGILPESFVLHWASAPPSSVSTLDSLSGEDTSSIDFGASDETLLLLFNFSSRGSGGCTMEWGVVVRCPSARVKDSETDICREKFHSTPEVRGDSEPGAVNESLNSAVTIQFPYTNPPRVLSSAFSPTNAVVVLAKPQVTTGDNRSKDTPEKCNTNWWTSVATGRTLVAGMQECPFEGVESCLGVTRKCAGSAADQTNQLGSSSGRVEVNRLCAECCELVWSRSESTTLRSTTTPNLDESLNKSSCSVANSTLRQRRKEIALAARPFLKGILKQRSYSESSGDEQATPSGALRFAGLADTHTDTCLSSDEFPTASSSEVEELVSPPSGLSTLAHAPSTFYELRRRRSQCVDGMRRCVSNEKLVSAESLPNELGVLNGGRQRRRSVNFSAHDQHVDYSPRDTVETLHHTLASRRKKARRREVRRRNFSGDACMSSSNNGPGRKSGNKRNGLGRQTQHFSGNNSYGTDIAQKAVEDISPEKSQSFDNAGDHPSPSDPSSPRLHPTINQSEVASPSPAVIHDANVATEVASTVLRAVDADSGTNKRPTCAVTLCATPLFELDEE